MNPRFSFASNRARRTNLRNLRESASFPPYDFFGIINDDYCCQGCATLSRRFPFPSQPLLVLRNLVLLRYLTLPSLFISALGTCSDASTSAVHNNFDLPSTSLPLPPRPFITSNVSRKRLVLHSSNIPHE